MGFFDDLSDRIGFGGNVTGTLDLFPGSRTKARIRNSMRIFLIPAPPLFWGGWQEVFAQAGVVEPDADKNVTEVNISFSSHDTGEPSSFDYEIKGGDHFIRGTAGASGMSEMVTITGNVATAVSVRAKSYLQRQNIRVMVS